MQNPDAVRGCPPTVLIAGVRHRRLPHVSSPASSIRISSHVAHAPAAPARTPSRRSPTGQRARPDSTRRFAGVRRVPQPVNEPIKSYAPGSPERAELKARLKSMAAEKIDIPLIIGGKEIRTGTHREVGDAARSRARAGRVPPRRARARPAGDRRRRRRAPRVGGWPWEDRAARAPARRRAPRHDLAPDASTPRRCSASRRRRSRRRSTPRREMIDFWRFNAYFAQELYSEQPISGPGVWNPMEYRDARRLRLRGHAVQLHRDRRQPDDRAGADGQHRDLEAGVERDAERLLHATRCSRRRACRPASSTSCPATPCEITNALLDSPELAGIHFTGSTAVFNSMWKKVGENIGRYRVYPRLVGETGGKDFIVAHPSADPQEVAVAIARGGFEYQGQKCSAASRVYVPQSLWDEVRDRAVAMMKEIKVGDVARLPQLHGRGHRQEGVRPRSAATSTTRRRTRRSCTGGDGEGREGLLHRADAGRDDGSRAIACCARRSSDRSSPRYVYPDAQVGGDARRSSTRRRRTR